MAIVISQALQEFYETTALGDCTRSFIAYPLAPVSTAEMYCYASASTAMTVEWLPPRPTRNYGAWRCDYCRMINDHTDLNCTHCGAPGEER